MSKRVVRFSLPQQFEAAVRFFGCCEDIEFLFRLEFSCGDGLFLSDILDNDALLEKHDGHVDETKFRIGDQIFSSGVLHCKYDSDCRYTGADEFSDVKVLHKKIPYVNH